jgi:anti-sigma28 factor (negative regulator of flagellin synthesis)
LKFSGQPGQEFAAMSSLSPIGSSQTERIRAAQEAAKRASTPAGRAAEAASRGADQVELSPMAGYMSKLRDLPVRQELVDRVRDEIDRGVYESAEKLNAAVDEMIGDMQG